MSWCNHTREELGVFNVRVSVISGYYNRGHLLERTVQSILKQSFKDFELYIFDDASRDGTREALAALAARLGDTRLRYVSHEENLGMTRGLIDAIAHTSGEFIAIQGSGDVSHPERLIRQVEFLDRHPDVGVVGCWSREVSLTGGDSYRRVQADDAHFEDFMRSNFLNHGTVMMRRSVYEQVGGYRPEFRYSQDRELWLRVIRVAKLATVPQVLYDRYELSDGVSFDLGRSIDQVRFSSLASAIQMLNLEDRQQILNELRIHGPTSVATVSNRADQNRIRKKVVWYGLNVDPLRASSVAAEVISRFYVRWPLVFLFRALGSGVGQKLSPLISTLRKRAKSWRAI